MQSTTRRDFLAMLSMLPFTAAAPAFAQQKLPVRRMPGTDTYVLTRFDDISDVLHRTDLFGRGASEDRVE